MTFPSFKISTKLDYIRQCARRWGQFTSVVIYDPQNRGAAYVEAVLTAAGLRFDIEDEGEPVSNPQPIDSAAAPRHDD